MKKFGASFCFLLVIGSFLCGCGVYSFTGASIDPSVKTFTIHFIKNQASIVYPSLSQTITNGLKNKFLTNSNLNQTENNGDLEFSGVITTYLVTPVAVQANETAALNRLTITVSIDFVNHKNDKQTWSSTFSRYADFNSSTDFTTVQDALIKDITDQLIEDIFNKSVVNW